ncbi:hypothetical protein WG915_06500 [Corynebacterium sp. H128]|uniref:DUF2339 domain-containing protein n=1 Tax=Corynebacterium sp. H128 TaxID=3133427 RepID=UPI0030B50EB7
MKISRAEQETLERVAQRLNTAESLLKEVRESLFELYEQSERSEAPVQQSVAPVATPVVEKRPTPPPKPRLSREKQIIRAVAVGGVLITLAGVSLLIALAIQSGWLGPLGRVIGAWVVAALLLGGAFLVKARGLAKEGFLALTTASLLTSILTVMATVSVLHWWPPIFGAVALLTLLALFSGLARWWDDELMLNITIVSSFVLFYLYIMSGDFFAFPVIATGLFMAVTSMQKRWFTSRSIASVIGPLAMLAALIDDPSIVVNSFPISLTVVIGVAVFLAVALLDEWQHKSDQHLGFYAPMAMLAIGALGANSFSELTIMFAVIIGFVALSLQFHGELAAWPLAVIPLMYVQWWSQAPALGSGSWFERPYLVALFFVAFGGFAWWLSRNNRFTGLPWATMIIAAILLSGELAKAVLLKKPLWLTDNIALLQVLTILGFMVVLYLVRNAFRGFELSAQILIGLAALHLSAMVLVTATTYLFGLGGETGMWLGYLVGHALVSISWMLVAAYILVISKAFTASTSLTIGLVLAVAAVVKLVFFDLGTLEGVPRVLAFLISGGALLLIASLRSKKANQL